MKEAYGGILNIVFVVIFLVIIEGILALVVSYTKAFKMKNSVISVIEEYEGSGCAPEASLFASYNTDSSCRRKIAEKANQINYAPPALHCPDTLRGDDGQSCQWHLASYNGKDLYCYCVMETSKDVKRKAALDGQTKTIRVQGYVYHVLTQVDLTFPLVSQITGQEFFSVSGYTKFIQKPNQ